ncbi:hypothetical protein PQC39_gp036 [Vibrio phage Vp_R1]|uniref:Uncharacterized protein n=1 Tax=Vibrio phage Vp_R1 TaxID=2059867 RepID=A0A2H5BPZ2_9CAUD|nr:hypothetical protein PQC39_gp036 [Vibrio phage Vp_R1]AUG88400.1 hypothetical protein VPR_036 [Vibrio phage Vp_R1]
MRDRVKEVGTFEGVTITEHYFEDSLVEAEYNLLKQDSYLNYTLVDGGHVEVTPSSADGDVFNDFLPTIEQLKVIHNHLLVKVLPTWSVYE